MLEEIVAKAVAASVEVAELKIPAEAELSLLFTDDNAVRSINNDWRGKDSATNVLSFPGADIKPGEPADFVLGDIVLAYETVAREAKLEDKPFEHHLSHLIVHGLLHLFGYDHMNDRQAQLMEGLETRILLRLAIDDPYGA